MITDEAQVPAAPEPKPGTSDRTALAKWIDERIDAKLRRERKFTRDVMAEIVAQLAKATKTEQQSNSRKRTTMRRAESGRVGKKSPASIHRRGP